MSITDILIVLFLIAGIFAGFNDGFTKSLVKFFGTFFIFILAYILKDCISEVLMKFLPFFPFGGLIKGVTVLNIALYEFIAFLIVCSILLAIFKVLLIASSVFEKVLNFTIILGLPSKLLGIVVTVLKNYLIVFFVLLFLSLPNFSAVSVVKKSKLKDIILKNTPLLSDISSDYLKVFDEFEILTKEYKNVKSPDKFNLDTLELFLKYKITSVKTVKYLVSSGKIKIKGIDKLLSRYD
ncbi:MAG: CvpA family protein [Bacilli bacterium]|nr:CvpA family protein [Bacilli bacterium]